MDAIEELQKLLLQWANDIVLYLPRLVLATAVMLSFYYLAKIARKYSYSFYSRSFGENSQLTTFLTFGTYAFLLLSGFFLTIEILGLESTITKIIAGAGVMGIVAGFALKDIASNAFAGFLLNMQKPFSKKDWVSIHSNFGTVESVGLLTTTIKSVSGQEVFVPNQLIYNDTFTNFSTYKKRRVILKSGVSYGDDLELVRKVALEEVKKIKNLIKKEEIDFYYTEIGSSTYNFEIRFWIKFHHQKDFLIARNDIIMLIKKRFEAENISIAYSVLTLDFGVKGGVNLSDTPLQLAQKS